MFKKSALFPFIIILALALLQSCEPQKNGTSNNPPDPTPSASSPLIPLAPSINVSSLAISVPSVPISRESTYQFSVEGIYPDGSKANLNSQVKWSSSNPKVALISDTGLITGKSWGTTRVSAAIGGITSNSVELTVIAKYAYVRNNDNTISFYKLNSVDGSLTFKSTLTATNLTNIALHPTLNYAYVLHGFDNFISVYSLNPQTGELKLLDSSSKITTGKNPVEIFITPNGKYAYVMNKGDSSISMYSVDSRSGLLAPLTPATVTTKEKNPVKMITDFAGRFAYVIDAGVASLSVYSIDQNSGQVTFSTPIAIPNPTDIILHPSGKFAYVTSAITPTSSSGTISIFNVQDNGNLSYQTKIDIDNYAATNIAIHPSGKFAYVTTTTGLLQTSTYIYSIDEIGQLTLLFTQQANDAKEINIEPTGKFAYFANWAGDSFFSSPIDQTSGQLGDSKIVKKGGDAPNSMKLF